VARERLQRFLAECGFGSRRKMEELIAEGKVRVNGEVVTVQGVTVDPLRDRVEVSRKLVRPLPKGLLLFHKPRGVVTTMSDPEGRPSVADYLTKKYRSYYPVGRLDWDSSGLVVCTNDGDIADRLMHPRYGFPRTYHARVEGLVTQETLAKLARGVRLADGPARGKAEILSSDEKTTWVEVVVAEGRNRLVRRLFERVGHPVMKLKRIAHGPFKVGKIQPGDIRPFTESEYQIAREKILARPERTREEAAAEAEQRAKKAALRRGQALRSGPGRRKAVTKRRSSRTRWRE
jgi:23S rRNA pseudouridine2605 synthase